LTIRRGGVKIMENEIITVQSVNNMPTAIKEKEQDFDIKHPPRFGNYFDQILKTSWDYLIHIFTQKELEHLLSSLKNKQYESNDDFVIYFNKIYCDIIKKKHQAEYEGVDDKLVNFIKSKKSNAKIVWGDCLNVLKRMDSESVQLMVTSPPYYNAREYSQWRNIDDYLLDMRDIIKETYRVLDNHKVWVFNVGDIFDNPNTATTSVWGKTRLPLGAYFIKIFEECGFTFVDDIIWDKGEVQSERKTRETKPYPLYQYPMNCYEHLLIFHKHRLDLTRYPCPRCGSLEVNGNTQSDPGLQSWECKNLKCFERSASNRGKRFSIKTNIVQSRESQNEKNKIELELLKKWRRDIVRFSPVIKINSKGENRLGHSAPFPKDIPEMAIKFFTYTGEVVLDPFAGSFTTVLSAVENNRIGVGIEINKNEYRGIAMKLFKDEQENFLRDRIIPEEFDLSTERIFNRQVK